MILSMARLLRRYLTTWQTITKMLTTMRMMAHVYTYHSERAVSLCVADEFEPIEATEGAMHLLNRVRAAELELRRSDAEL